jgi:hypothetical protein
MSSVVQPLSRKEDTHSFRISYEGSDEIRRKMHDIPDFDSVKVGDWLISIEAREMGFYDKIHAYRITKKTAKRLTIRTEEYDNDYRGTFLKNTQLSMRSRKSSFNKDNYIVFENKSKHITIYLFMTDAEFREAIVPFGGWSA